MNAATIPAVELYDGAGDLSVSGSLTITSLGGRVAVSPVPHLGIHVRGAMPRSRFDGEQASLWTVEQSEVGAGISLYGPTEGLLRTELTVDLASGLVTGFGEDSVSSALCVMCRPTLLSDLYRVDATRTRQSVAVTVAADGGVFGLGMTVGLSRVTVSGVERGGSIDVPSAAGMVLDNAVFVQSRSGAGTLRLWAGSSVAVGEDARADADGTVRGLGGRYRAST